MIPVKVLAVRYLANAGPALCQALGVPEGCPSLAMLTTDCDDATYIALDAATKAAEVEVGYTLLHSIEGDYTAPDKVEELLICLTLPDKAIEHLGHKEGDGRFANIVRNALQQCTAMYIPHTVQLGLVGYKSLELKRKHRLQQRQFGATTLTGAYTLHDIALTTEGVGQQMYNYRLISVFDTI